MTKHAFALIAALSTAPFSVTAEEDRIDISSPQNREIIRKFCDMQKSKSLRFHFIAIRTSLQTGRSVKDVKNTIDTMASELPCAFIQSQHKKGLRRPKVAFGG